MNANYGFLIAIVHLNDEKLKQYGEVNGFSQDTQELSSNKSVHLAVLKQLKHLGTTSNLADIE